jgi:hypothetical protein
MITQIIKQDSNIVNENDLKGLSREFNAAIQSDDKTLERLRLEGTYGQVWNTDQARDTFEFDGFCAPYVTVIRKSDNVRGTLEFQHSPRFYFNFQPI